MTTIIIMILGLAGMAAGLVRVGLYATGITGSPLTMYPLLAAGTVITMPIIIVAIAEIRDRQQRVKDSLQD